MPRVVGTRCGVNSTCTASPLTWESACSISAVWRWVSRPYAVTFSSTSENRLVVFGPRPAPDTPDTAFTTMPVGSTKPCASSGASASDDAVG